MSEELSPELLQKAKEGLIVTIDITEHLNRFFENLGLSTKEQYKTCQAFLAILCASYKIKKEYLLNTQSMVYDTLMEIQQYMGEEENETD